MGGVAKHLMHLYDDKELTYNNIKKILTQASSGELKGTEKTDGFNIYLGVIKKKGTWLPAWARNKGDMKEGGRTFADLAARKFGGSKARATEVKKVYLDAFKAYQKAINSLNRNQLAAIFGTNSEIFYNTEIQGPSATSVVNYDKNIISIHHVNHKRYNPETNQLEVVDATKNSAILDNLIDQFEQATAEEDFSIRRTAFLKLNELDNDYDLNIALQRMQKSGFSGSMSIGEYLENYIKNEVERKLSFLNLEIQQNIVNRILKKEDHFSLTQIYKGFPIEVKEKIKNFVDNSPFTLKDAIWPIESAIHDFSIELLKSLKSAYILDNESELTRLKNEVGTAIKGAQKFQGEDQEKVHKALARQLEKLKHHDNITTVVEGFVFQIGNQLYKFTGNFAPINQILRLFKFPRGSLPPIQTQTDTKPEQQITETEDDAQIIALIPGKFKPPHRGHLEMAKHYSNIADKVIVLVSPLPREYAEGKEVSAEDSVRIWQIYLKSANLTNVIVEIAEYNSPVQAAMEYGNKPEIAGSKILLGASTKGGDAAQRFGSNLQRYVPNVDILDPLKYAYETKGDNVLHASDFRAELAKPEKNIDMFIPEEAKNRIPEILSILGETELNEEKSPIPLGLFLRLIEEGIDEAPNETEEAEIELALPAEIEKEKEKEKEKQDAKEEKEKKESGLQQTQDELKDKAEQTRDESEDEQKEKEQEETLEKEIKEISAMGAGAVEGGAVFKKKKKNTANKENNEELVKEVLDYLISR